MNRYRLGPAAGSVLLAALFLMPGSARAAGTSANTSISSTATATYTDPGGAPQTVTSNTSTITVDELLDVAVSDGGNVPATSPATDAPLAFTVTNTGNGSEPFELRAQNVAGDQFDPANIRIYLDDGDGVFGAGDVLYVLNGNDPVLAPDAQRLVFVIGDIPAGRPSGDAATLSLRASALTAGDFGSPAGTLYGGVGDGGTDAVAGVSTASVLDLASYVVSAVSGTLIKVQAVLDPFGGGNPVPGAAITYTLTFTLSGSGSITTGQIVDPIPANTTYVPSSLTLNDAPLTDAADADAGRFNVNRIEVNLASPLAAPSTQTVTFQVTIN